MKLKSIVLLAVAVGCGLIAMLGVQQVLSGNRAAPREETVKVLLATSDIAPGVPLDESNTSFKSFPKSALPEGVVTKKEQFEQRSLNVKAVTGEMIMMAKLGEKGIFGASAEIPEGMRVVTVQTNQTTTHSGLIRPGDRVDVLVTYKIRRPEAGMIAKTKTVLEYIKVFATDHVRAGNSTDAGEHSAKNISLLVDPEQANLLMLAESKGAIHLALRHKSDTTPVKTEAVDESMFDEEETKVGQRDEDLSAPGAPSGETASVREFLEQQTQVSAPAEPVVAQPAMPVEKPKWKIQIYAGDTQRVEEVELPEESQERADASGANGLLNEAALGRIWKGLIQKFFVGA